VHAREEGADIRFLSTTYGSTESRPTDFPRSMVLLG
jgi:hypothetical protein